MADERPQTGSLQHFRKRSFAAGAYSCVVPLRRWGVCVCQLQQLPENRARAVSYMDGYYRSCSAQCSVALAVPARGGAAVIYVYMYIYIYV